MERLIGAIKHFERVSQTYDGGLKKFNREFNIATGLANLRHTLRNNTYGHWAKILGLSVHDTYH